MVAEVSPWYVVCILVPAAAYFFLLAEKIEKALGGGALGAIVSYVIGCVFTIGGCVAILAAYSFVLDTIDRIRAKRNKSERPSLEELGFETPLCPYSSPCPVWRCEREKYCHVWRPENPEGTDFRPLKNETLAEAFPDLAKEWHPSKNGKLTPETTKVGSRKKIWWICHIDDLEEGRRVTEEWKTPIRKRLKPDGCPFETTTGFYPGMTRYSDLPRRAGEKEEPEPSS